MFHFYFATKIHRLVPLAGQLDLNNARMRCPLVICYLLAIQKSSRRSRAALAHPRPRNRFRYFVGEFLRIYLTFLVAHYKTVKLI